MLIALKWDVHVTLYWNREHACSDNNILTDNDNKGSTMEIIHVSIIIDYMLATSDHSMNMATRLKLVEQINFHRTNKMPYIHRTVLDMRLI